MKEEIYTLKKSWSESNQKMWYFVWKGITCIEARQTLEEANEAFDLAVEKAKKGISEREPDQLLREIKLSFEE